MSEPKAIHDASGPGGEEGWLSRDRVMAMVLIAATLITFYLCYLVLSPFLPALAFALALAVVARPLHVWLAGRIRHQGFAAGVTVAVVALLIVVPTLFVMQNIVGEAIDASRLAQRELSDGRVWETIEKYPQIASLYGWIAERVDLGGIAQQAAGFLSASTMTLLGGSVSAIVNVLITFFSLFFFLRDRDTMLKMLRSLAPLSRREADRMLGRVTDTIRATVFGTLVVAAIQGALGGLMFWWLGLPGPVLWGSVMALLSVVPVLGAFIVWIPAAIFLAIGGEWTKAIILTVWGSLVVGFIDNLLYPILVGRKLRMHTLPVFFSIVGGLVAFGTAGLILGPLVLAVAAALIDLWRMRMEDGGTAEEPV
jgi:predicted PurR-regulated permease PerM